MNLQDGLISELAELCGIINEYWDIFGKRHETSIETQKAILRAMKMRIDSEEDIRREINKKKTYQWNRLIEPVKVISVREQPLKIHMFVPLKEDEEATLLWSIEDEHGQRDDFIIAYQEATILEEQWINGKRHLKIELSDKTARGIGYYSINVECRRTGNILSGKSRLIITPDACYIPPSLIGDWRSQIAGSENPKSKIQNQKSKTWGLSINLYAVASDANWGIGDLGDLKKIIQWIADLKGSFIGINPLHAIANKKPFGISPYSPLSRLYKNFVYLNMEDITEVAESDDLRAIIESNEFKSELERVKMQRLIDYEAIASCKERILRQAFDIFLARHYLPGSERAKDFNKYLSEEDDLLDSFATYMALRRHEVNNGRGEDWHGWSEEYRDPQNNAVKEFKKNNDKEALYYKYVQWLIDRQLEKISHIAERSGMHVGIYHDLAIGSVGCGSDAWMAQDMLAYGMSVGAPPDDFNLEGQNWGFPPIIPEKLKETGYELFIQIIRKNMKHCGAIRIDHALGMFRLFWIPDGMKADSGAYVSCPAEDLLRIIALESMRNRTMVIAEDLGTVGDNVREMLNSFNMLSYRLLYFERNYPDSAFLQPDKYPVMALCAVTTHDLPTIYGWWVGRDIEVKKRLGIYSGEDILQRDIENRERDKTLLLNVLQSQGLLKLNSKLQTPNSMTPELCLAIYEYLARTPCRLLSVSLDDAIGVIDQQNMPGITDSYPSWMQKTPVMLEEFIDNKRFNNLSLMLCRNNRCLI
ncbi:MAG: 4-alpha-glucanotransferase [Thermodesulfovibrionales bacterium]|nr:4-alpha-glucanotransferase [Thermodesulfovibrionales bacterium]